MYIKSIPKDEVNKLAIIMYDGEPKELHATLTEYIKDGLLPKGKFYAVDMLLVLDNAETYHTVRLVYINVHGIINTIRITQDVARDLEYRINQERIHFLIENPTKQYLLSHKTKMKILE